MKEGDKVRYRDREGVWKGTLAIDEPGAMLLELDHPIPFLSAPKAIIVEEVDERMHLPETTVLGYGTRQLLEDNDALPPGHYIDDQGRLYQLDEPMKIQDIKAHCKNWLWSGESKVRKKSREEPLCWLQAVMLTAVPIDKKGPYAGTVEAV